MEITREQLKAWYESMTTAELMTKLGIANSASLYYLLDKAEIKRKRPNKNKSVFSRVKLVD